MQVLTNRIWVILLVVLKFNRGLRSKEIYNRDLDFHYRSSLLQRNPNLICIEATLVLKRAIVQDILTLIEDRKQKD